MTRKSGTTQTRSRRAPERSERERGAAIIEFALVFPLLAMLLFGTITGGLVMNRRISVAQAAREAARYGATVDSAQCTTVSVCGGRTWAEQVKQVAVSRAGGDAAAADVCVALVSGAGTSPVAVSTTHTTKGALLPCYVDNSADSGKRVQVVIRFTDRIQAVVTSVPIDFTTSATARFEQ